MGTRIVGLLGVAAALGTIGTAQATPPPAPSDALQANSYADLLEPIPNALALLQTVDEQTPVERADANVQVAQYHHHHHHHHGYYRYRRWRYYHHHHHHHHHHHGYYRY